MKPIPESTGIPIFGNFLEYRRNRLRFLGGLQHSLGDLAIFKMGKTKVILATHPDDVQWILQKNAKNYLKATNLSIVLGKGILTSEHDLWRRQRKLIQPLFHQGHIFSLIPLMNQKVEASLKTLEKHAIDGTSVRVSDTVMRLAYEIVGEALFGAALDQHFDRLHRTINYLNLFLTKRLYQMVKLPLNYPLPSHLKFKRMKADLDQVIYGLIDEKKNEIDSGNAKKDLVSLLIQAKDEDSGEIMDAEQIRDEALTLLLAGHETTGHTLAWIFYFLAKYPDVQKKLIEEMDRVLQGRSPNSDDLFELNYMSQVIDETLRVFPPVWAWTRKSVEADALRGHAVPAGSILFLCPYLTHRHPDFWSKPEEFNPDHFLESAPEKNKGAYFPFGLGPRQCIGKHFALMEVRIVLSIFLQKFEILPDLNLNAVPHPQVTMGITNGLSVKLKHRTSNPTSSHGQTNEATERGAR